MEGPVSSWWMPTAIAMISSRFPLSTSRKRLIVLQPPVPGPTCARCCAATLSEAKCRSGARKGRGKGTKAADITPGRQTADDHRLSEGNREAMAARSSGAAKFQTALAPRVCSRPAQFSATRLWNSSQERVEAELTGARFKWAQNTRSTSTTAAPFC